MEMNGVLSLLRVAKVARNRQSLDLVGLIREHKALKKISLTTSRY